MPNTTKLEGNRGYAVMETGGNTISNTINKSPLFTTVIPGGKMGSNKILKLELTCQLTTPALSIPSLALRLEFGSASVVLATGLISANLTDRPLLIEAKIANQGNSNQYVTVKVLNNSGLLIFAGLSSSFLITDTSWTVDTTVDQTLAVTAQFGGLSTTTSIITKLVELNLT